MPFDIRDATPVTMQDGEIKYRVLHKLVPLAFQYKCSMSSCKKYKNYFYVMFAITRRKLFSIIIKGVSL